MKAPIEHDRCIVIGMKIDGMNFSKQPSIGVLRQLLRVYIDSSRSNDFQQKKSKGGRTRGLIKNYWHNAEPSGHV